jgi:hypothetical protein
MNVFPLRIETSLVKFLEKFCSVSRVFASLQMTLQVCVVATRRLTDETMGVIGVLSHLNVLVSFLTMNRLDQFGRRKFTRRILSGTLVLARVELLMIRAVASVTIERAHVGHKQKLIPCEWALPCKNSKVSINVLLSDRRTTMLTNASFAKPPLHVGNPPTSNLIRRSHG